MYWGRGECVGARLLVDVGGRVGVARRRVGSPLAMCTADPALDVGVSASLHREHHWQWEQQHAATYAAAACTAERPYMLDVGANIGMFSLLAARLGCRVLAFVPLSANLARAAQSAARNGLLGRLRVLKHAVGAAWARVQLRLVPNSIRRRQPANANNPPTPTRQRQPANANPPTPTRQRTVRANDRDTKTSQHASRGRRMSATRQAGWGTASRQAPRRRRE